MRVLLCLLLLLYTIFSFTELKAQRAYISRDTTTIVGVNLIPGSAAQNAQFIRLKDGKEIIQYSPDEIAGYRLSDGKVYVSRNVALAGSEKKVFLQKLVQGEMDLYYYTEDELQRFFLETQDGQLMPLSEQQDFRQTLSRAMSDCEAVSEAIRLVSYRKNSLSRLVEMYNDCEERPFPYPKVGIAAGFQLTNIIVQDAILDYVLNLTDFQPRPTLSIGVFAELPIEATDLSFHTGLFASYNRFNVFAADTSLYRVLVNIITLDIPLMTRYSFPTAKLRPFINAGAVLSYHIRNTNGIYVISDTGNSETPNLRAQQTILSDLMPGLALGGGLQYPLDYRRLLSLEVRYTRSYGRSNNLTDVNTLSKSNLSILLGYTF